MAKHKRKKLVFQGVLPWIKTCWYESNYMFWWRKHFFNKISSHRAIFSKSCLIKVVTHNLHSKHRVTKCSLTRATIQTDICFHLGSWSAVVYLEQTPCWGAALVGLGWTPLLFSLHPQDAGQKTMAQQTHAVTQLPLLARECAMSCWRLGWLKRTPWAPSSSSSSPLSKMRGGTLEPNALFNEGPLFCCFDRRNTNINKEKKTRNLSDKA